MNPYAFSLAKKIDTQMASPKKNQMIQEFPNVKLVVGGYGGMFQG